MVQSFTTSTVFPGLGGALGYMLGGLDWTGTALGRAFKSQEQVLFLFASIIFIISVTLHLFSIPEQPFVPSSQLQAADSGESSSQASFRAISHLAPLLDAISEEDISAPAAQEDGESEEEEEVDFLAVDRVRSKSDSILAMPDSTVELDPDLDPIMQLFFPDPHHFLLDTGIDLEDVFKASHKSDGSTSPSEQPPLTDGAVVADCPEPNGPTRPPPSDPVGPYRQAQVESGAPHQSVV